MYHKQTDPFHHPGELPSESAAVRKRRRALGVRAAAADPAI